MLLVSLSKGAAVSLSRPVIAYIPLLFISVVLRGDSVRLSEVSRFFVWFSLVSAFGSQGIGNYVHSLIVASSGTATIQLLRMLVVLRQMTVCRWTLFSILISFASFLWFVSNSNVLVAILVSVVAAVAGPLLLVLSQIYISRGMSSHAIKLTCCQSLLSGLMLLLLLKPGSNQAISSVGILAFSGISLVVYILLKPICKCRLNIRAFTSPSRIVKRASLNKGSRVKCLFDSLLPPVYVALVILSFSRADSMQSDRLVFAYYSYSRISDALISLVVVLYSYFIVARRKNKLHQGSPCGPQSVPVASRKNLDFPTLRIAFWLFAIITAMLVLGYVYNCVVTAICIDYLIAFDYAASVAKLGYVIGSFYFAILIPRSSLAVQVLSVLSIGLISCMQLTAEKYMIAYALISWICLLIPVFCLFRVRSSGC